MKIDADMLISDILSIDPAMSAILMKKGMHCISCVAAAGESLRMAGYVHGMSDEEIDELTAQLNDYVSGTEEDGAEI